MNAQLIANAEHYFEQNLGKNLQDLTRPFGEEAPCGPDLRVEKLFTDIKEARRADDPSLPRGDWQIELKRADWVRVTELVTSALLEESKDLQLSTWLLESEIKQRGLQAVAPCLTLIHMLVDEYWESLNPAVDELERRYNIFRWIDEKMPHCINLTAIAQSKDEAETLSGADLDRAYENQHLIDSKQVQEDELSGPFVKDLETLVSRTSDEFYTGQYAQAEEGIEALNTLEQKLDELFTESQAPGFSDLRKQLEKNRALAESELCKRDVFDEFIKQKQQAGFEQSAGQNGDSQADEHQDLAGQSSGEAQQEDKKKEVLDRQQAYQKLADIAHYLAEIEPHSPVPYLVMRAVEWGSYNTAELYQDLFLINKGQIDLFEMMGIIDHQEQQAVPQDA